jgi:NADPH-dependent 2,4-dienoyl-CoA reductase/sulfur reductase-like enzyme
MHHYPYVIIGAGMTAAAAVRGIREIDSEGQIAVLGREPYAPYQRPPLSKGLWAGKSVDDIWCEMPEHNVDLYLSREVTAIDRDKRTVSDTAGETFHYDTLLLATGGVVRQLPEAVEGLIHYRTLDDFHALHAVARKGTHIAVIGGGFIGSEVAAALARNECRVTMIFPDEAIGSRIYPSGLALFLDGYYRARGVELFNKDSVTAMALVGEGYRLNTRGGQVIDADAVVVGIGITPDTALAEAAGLTVDNGIIVDEFLRTDDEVIYAAGDVANFHNPALNERMRVEHEDNAVSMGEIAGKNMAGTRLPYTHLPYFYSDLFDFGYEAVGRLDTRLDMVEEWHGENYHKGIVYYCEDGRVRGVLLWNVWDQVEAATRLIESGEQFTPDELRGRLPE